MAKKTTTRLRHRILAIEDDEGAYQILRAALRDLPVEIIHAHSGQRAIELLNEELPALIFLDIDLPDMHGWQVLEKFKDSGRIAKTPIIVLTAHRDPVHRLIGSLQSVAVYMQKPFKREELQAQVRSLLHL